MTLEIVSLGENQEIERKIHKVTSQLDCTG